MNTEELAGLCRRHILDSEDVVVKEPYIPYIPDDWNGVLVLAESQNLSSSNSGYVERLKEFNENERIRRLNPKINANGNVGVWPWDDGSLKLAVEAAFEEAAASTAVSNAVLWSQRDDSGANVNPDVDLQARSSKLWEAMLAVISPNYVVTCGKIAYSVIVGAGWNESKIKGIRSSSPNAMSRVSGMFKEDDLLSRYPEVKQVLDAHPKWLDGGYRQNKIFFACHAVSLYGNKKESHQ